MRHRYYLLAWGTRPLPRAAGFPWPYEVWLCLEPVSRPVSLAEGVGHGAAATLLSARDALAPHWRAHFANAGGEWLLPYVERLEAGERLDPRELLPLGVSTLGCEPESFLSGRE